jgi:hypothetical protein
VGEIENLVDVLPNGRSTMPWLRAETWSRKGWRCRGRLISEA